MTRTVFIPGILGVVLLLGGSIIWTATNAGAPLPAAQRGIVKPGESAPNFQLRDMNGQIVSLSDLRGKVVLINFWASWCTPCVRETPDLKAAYLELTNGQKETAIAFVGIGLQDETDKLKKFADDNAVLFRERGLRGSGDSNRQRCALDDVVAMDSHGVPPWNRL